MGPEVMSLHAAIAKARAKRRMAPNRHGAPHLVRRIARLVCVMTRRRRTTAALLIQQNAITVTRRWSVRWITLMVAAAVAWIWLGHPVFVFAIGLTALGTANSAYAWYRLAKYRANPSTHAS